MDFWASLEHHLRYKKKTIDSEDIGAKLLECANVIADTDQKMQEILYQIMDRIEESDKYRNVRFINDSKHYFKYRKGFSILPRE